MEGLTGTKHITADAMKVTGTAKRAMSARMHIGWCPARRSRVGECKPAGFQRRAHLSFGSALFPDRNSAPL
jgi:hypothetical protein